MEIFAQQKTELTFEEGATKNEKEKKRSVIFGVHYSSMEFSFIFKMCSLLSHMSHVMCRVQLSGLSALSTPSVEKLDILKFTKWTQAKVCDSHSTVRDDDPLNA